MLPLLPRGSDRNYKRPFNHSPKSLSSFPYAQESQWWGSIFIKFARGCRVGKVGEGRGLWCKVGFLLLWPDVPIAPQ